MLVGEGASKFAKAIGMEEVPTSALVNTNAVEAGEHFKKFKNTVNELFKPRYIYLNKTFSPGLICLKNVTLIFIKEC